MKTAFICFSLLFVLFDSKAQTVNKDTLFLINQDTIVVDSAAEYAEFVEYFYAKDLFYAYRVNKVFIQSISCKGIRKTFNDTPDSAAIAKTADSLDPSGIIVKNDKQINQQILISDYMRGYNDGIDYGSDLGEAGAVCCATAVCPIFGIILLVNKTDYEKKYKKYMSKRSKTESEHYKEGFISGIKEKNQTQKVIAVSVGSSLLLASFSGFILDLFF